MVSAEQRAWLEQSVPMHAEGDNRFVHGGWNDPMDEYLYRIDAQTVPAQARRLFSGHTHVQTLAVIGERTYCNPARSASRAMAIRVRRSRCWTEKRSACSGSRMTSR